MAALLVLAITFGSAPTVVTTAASASGVPAGAPEAIPATALAAPIATPATESAVEAPGPIPDGYRILIPRLGIDLALKEGDVARDIVQQRTPEGYAFHLPGTAIPGQIGNTFLYAHARTGMFLSLWSARAGDEIIIDGPAGEVLAYVIRAVLPRVASSDMSPTLPTAGEQLTLQTSTGPSPSDPRFVVLAFRKGP